MLSLDTHIVVFFLTGQLTPKEFETVSSQERGVSAMVLWELAILHRLERIPMGLHTPAVKSFLDHCHIWQIDPEIAIRSTQLDFRSDPADELIAATSIVHSAPLLTRDQRIRTSKLVPFA